MRLKFLSVCISSAILITGCTSSNVFGVGYEHSACESSSQSGVCGAPKDIYKYRDKIRKVQSDYLRSGIAQKLFFGIAPNGDILVKDKRNGLWQRYKTSKYRAVIEERLYRNEQGYTQGYSMQQPVNGYIDEGSAITDPSDDLAIQYKRKRASMLQTNTNVGNIIRTAGEIRKVWIAPVEDKKGDLISAHEVYTVVKKPKWVVGEDTPKYTKYSLAKKPTPLNINVQKASLKTAKKEDALIRNYINQ